MKMLTEAQRRLLMETANFTDAELIARHATQHNDTVYDPPVKSLPMKVYPNQEAVAKRVCEALKTESLYVSVTAPMQYGKSGIICAIAREMSKTSDVLYLTAVSDLNVQRQNVINFSPEKIKILDKFLFRRLITDNGLTAISDHVPMHSTLIIDEGHFGMGDTSLVGTFFKQLIDERKVRLVVVSATNYVFDYSNLGVKSTKVFPTPKEVKESGYRSVEDLLPFIVDTGNTCNPCKNITALVTAVFRLKENARLDDAGYMFIRADKDFKQKYGPASGADLFDPKEIRLLFWDQEDKEVFDLDQLQHKPDLPTVIVVNEYLSLGKVIPHKQHIQCMFDRVSKGTALDTCLQGFLGRMCGFTSNGNLHPDFKIYTSLERAQEYVDTSKNEYKVLRKEAKETYKVSQKVTRIRPKATKDARNFKYSFISTEDKDRLYDTGNYAWHNVSIHKSKSQKENYKRAMRDGVITLQGYNHEKAGMILSDVDKSTGVWTHKLIEPKTQKELEETVEVVAQSKGTLFALTNDATKGNKTA